MDIVSELGSNDLIPLGRSHVLKLQRKLSRGVEMVDLRVWVKWNQDGSLHPSNNGIMMELSKFKVIMPMMEGLLARD